MNREEPNAPDEVLELLAEACNGRLSPEQDERLAHLLVESEEVRRLWVEFSRMHVELHVSSKSQRVMQRSYDVIDDLIAGVGDAPDRSLDLASTDRRPSRSPSPIRWIGWSAAAVVLLAVGYAISSLGPQDAGDPPAPAELADVSDDAVARPRYPVRPQPDAVAVLSRQSDAVWGEQGPLPDGALITARKIELLSGHAQVDMLSGVTLVLQGPTELVLVSPMEVLCSGGRLRASVPEGAEGFVVQTPTHRAIDLGTEFAVNVRSREDSEIHVIDGEMVVEPVDANQDENHGAKLTSGQAVRSQPGGLVSRMPANVDAFIDAEALMAMSREHERVQRESWAAAEAEFSARDDLLLYYGFQGHQDWARSLRQDGPRNQGISQGAIVGCDWSVGRFSGRRALEFKGTEDRVRLRIPGEFDSLTFHIWVRIDGLDRMYNSLLMTVGHELGEPHWQINERGELVLGIKGYPNDYFGPPFNDKGHPILNHDYSTATLVGPNDLGVWMNLTSVFDAQRDEVRHYKNGVRQSTERLVREVKLRLGECELGNWTPIGGTHQAVRALNGRIDELAVFDRPLTDEEIQDLHQSGRP